MFWPWHYGVYNKLSTDRSTHMFTGYFLDCHFVSYWWHLYDASNDANNAWYLREVMDQALCAFIRLVFLHEQVVPLL